MDGTSKGKLRDLTDLKFNAEFNSLQFGPGKSQFFRERVIFLRFVSNSADEENP
jgi:hypothetical protein